MQRHEIRFSQQALDRRIPHPKLCFLRGSQPVAVAIEHPRAEAARHAGRKRADLAEADDADGFAEQSADIGNAGPIVRHVVIGAHAIAIPAVFAHRVVSLQQLLSQRQHHQDRVLGSELQRRTRHA